MFQTCTFRGTISGATSTSGSTCSSGRLPSPPAGLASTCAAGARIAMKPPPRAGPPPKAASKAAGSHPSPRPRTLARTLDYTYFVGEYRTGKYEHDFDSEADADNFVPRHERQACSDPLQGIQPRQVRPRTAHHRAVHPAHPPLRLNACFCGRHSSVARICVFRCCLCRCF